MRFAPESPWTCPPSGVLRLRGGFGFARGAGATATGFGVALIAGAWTDLGFGLTGAGRGVGGAFTTGAVVTVGAEVTVALTGVGLGRRAGARGGAAVVRTGGVVRGGGAVTGGVAVAVRGRVMAITRDAATAGVAFGVAVTVRVTLTVVGTLPDTLVRVGRPGSRTLTLGRPIVPVAATAAPTATTAPPPPPRGAAAGRAIDALGAARGVTARGGAVRLTGTYAAGRIPSILTTATGFGTITSTRAFALISDWSESKSRERSSSMVASWRRTTTISFGA